MTSWKGELYFAHERLDCYRLARDVAQWMDELDFPRGDSDLRDQARRAARSVALNIAEGASSSGKTRRHHFNVAAGSAAEAGATLDFIRHPDAAENQDKLRRVVLMLRKLT